MLPNIYWGQEDHLLCTMKAISCMRLECAFSKCGSEKGADTHTVDSALLFSRYLCSLCVWPAAFEGPSSSFALQATSESITI